MLMLRFPILSLKLLKRKKPFVLFLIGQVLNRLIDLLIMLIISIIIYDLNHNLSINQKAKVPRCSLE